MIEKSTSNKIAEMSLFAAFLIVALHVYAEFSKGTIPYFVYVTLRGLASIAVPYFCVVSGFFLAVHMGEEGWWGKAIRKRLGSLVAPFFFWNFMAWMFYAVLYFVAAARGISFGADAVEGMNVRRACSWMGFNLFAYPIHGRGNCKTPLTRCRRPCHPT